MAGINELIAQFCPNGVPFKRLEEVASYIDGAAHENILGDQGEYVVTKVKFISSDGQFRKYCNVRLSPVEKDDIIMVMSDLPNGKSLAKCFLIDKDNTYTINQRVCSLTANTAILLPRFLYYVLNRNAQLLKYDNGYNQTHLKKKWILDVKIPVPPIDIQSEIVRILDTFLALIDNLQKELLVRKKQFEFCQLKLFDFGSDTLAVSLAGCCTLEKGQTAIQKAVPGNYPLVVTASKRKSSNDFQFDKATVCIPLVSSRGHGVASINQVFYEEGKFALGNILCGVTPLNPQFLSAKYLYYLLNWKKDTLLVPLMKGGANVSLTVNSLKKVKVPVPSIEEQVSIVAKIKPLEELIEAIECEIALRKQQYSYYKDKLLTFKEASL